MEPAWDPAAPQALPRCFHGVTCLRRLTDWEHEQSFDHTAASVLPLCSQGSLCPLYARAVEGALRGEYLAAKRGDTVRGDAAKSKDAPKSKDAAKSKDAEAARRHTTTHAHALSEAAARALNELYCAERRMHHPSRGRATSSPAIPRLDLGFREQLP